MLKSKIAPFIYEKTKDGEVVHDVFSRLVKDRNIFLSEEIDTELATIITASLLFLDNQNNDPIKLYINSQGGEVHSGLFTIYDTMNYVNSPIHTICVGEAYSAASTLLSSGAKRLAFPNANIMIHEIQTFHGNHVESTTETVKRAKRTEILNQKLIDIFAKNTNQPREEVKKLFKETTYFSAKEALDFGIIDEIVEKKTNKRKSKSKRF